jgi:hypothetical protein
MLDRLGRSQPAPDTDMIILLAAGWAWHARARTTSWTAKTRSAEPSAPEYSRSR